MKLLFIRPGFKILPDTVSAVSRENASNVVMITLKDKSIVTLNCPPGTDMGYFFEQVCDNIDIALKGSV